MNSKTPSLRLNGYGKRLAMLLGTASLLAIANVITDPGRSYAADADGTSDQMTENVVVTGSLLGAADFQAPTPVTPITSEEIQTRSLTGIGTVIEELPFAATGGGDTRNTSGVEAASQDIVNLRSIGANNTLVLINGERPTPVNSTNNFDLNMIPASLVDHFDVVTTGASATYGADAVAGAINFVLRDHIDGFESNLQYGSSQSGDENQILASANYGTSFADGKGHFLIGGEYSNEYNTVTMYARAWGRLEPGLVAVTNPTAGEPYQLLVDHAEVDNSAEGGLIVGCAPAKAACPIGATPGSGGTSVAFNAAGQPYDFPTSSIAGSTYMVSTQNYGASGINRDLAPPYDREDALARVDYDITPNINAFFMINVGESNSADPFIGQTFPLVMTVYSGNPFIPASIQQQMTANGITSITVDKEHIDGLGGEGDIAFNKTTLIQAQYGVKGSIWDGWSWDVEGTAGHAEFWQNESGVPLVGNLDSALYAVTGANGMPVCGPAATNPGQAKIVSGNGELANPLTDAQIAAESTPGCVPYDPFGTPSAASVAYVTNTSDGGTAGRSSMRQYEFNADLRGSPYTLPAGPLDLALGANWRYNSYEFLGTPADVASLFIADYKPSYYINESVWELYGEAGIPVVKDLPFAQAIDLNLAGRYTDYSLSGSVFTWKYGATWDITDWLRIRATKSEDIRAPNFSELNPLGLAGAGNLVNPLDNASMRISTLETYGNPNLHSVFANNETIGFVFQPTWDFLSGFKASIDYYRIYITGSIAAVGAQQIINYCLVNKLQNYCNQIFFDNGQYGTPGSDITTGFGITTVNSYDVNLNSEIQSGFDLDFSEHFKLEEWLGIPGSFTISALGQYVQQQTTNNLQANGTILSVDDVDSGGTPRWSWDSNLTYSVNRWTAHLQMRYYSPIKYSTTEIGPNESDYSPSNPLSINQNVFPAAITYNLHLAYDVIQDPDGHDLQVYLNVDNLLDTPPPVIWSYVSNYDVLGRYFKVGVRYKIP